jgi:hypothetical protein
MNVYKTLYMQSAISSFLQDCIHDMNNKLKFNFVHVLWKNQWLPITYEDNHMFDNPNFVIINI